MFINPMILHPSFLFSLLMSVSEIKPGVRRTFLGSDITGDACAQVCTCMCVHVGVPCAVRVHARVWFLGRRSPVRSPAGGRLQSHTAVRQEDDNVSCEFRASAHG